MRTRTGRVIDVYHLISQGNPARPTSVGRAELPVSAVGSAQFVEIGGDGGL